jgi:glycosyltransferase involved in cell wall biosynthesis
MPAEKRLRVLVISLGRIGGVTKYGFLMADALSALCDVAAVTSTTADNRHEWSHFDGPRLEVDTFSSVGTMLASYFDFARFRRIARFARDFAPDVVYYPGGHAYKPVLDFRLPKAPIVLTVHDPELHRGEDTLAQRLFAWANLRRCDGYVLLNRTQAAGFAKRHHVAPERVAVVPLGLFDDHVDDTIPLAQIPGAEALAEQAGRYALFVGRIERYKGIGTLLCAYAELDPSERIPLVIAGAGELAPEERGLLGGMPAGTVTLLNRWLSETEVATLVASARFAVVPYVHATQSAVIPLAYAHGVPVIASDAGGLAEQVVDGETGLTFAAGDVAALTATLRTAFALSDDRRDALARAAFDYGQVNWGWAALARRLATFLAAVRRS